MPLAPTPAPPLQPHPASPHSPPQQHAPAAAAAAASCPVTLSPPSESLSLQSEVGAAPPQPHAAGRPSQLRPRPVRRGGGT